MSNVLEMFDDQSQKLFVEIMRSRNGVLLAALRQQKEPSQEERDEVIKLLSDEFSLNLDETSEPTARGQEIDALLGQFLLRWPVERDK